VVAKLLLAVVVVGIASGFFITFYELLITFLTWFIFMGDPLKTIPTLPVWYLYLVPTVAIFIVNTIISRNQHIREYSINEIAESVSRNTMILTLRTLLLKIVTSALSLASGFPVGTEGPSAGMGAMIAYQVHRYLKLPTIMTKMMISVGASSGIAAIFVSPITGMAFAIENIAHQFVKQYVGYLILASVIAFSVSIQFLDPILFRYSEGRTIDLIYLMENILFIPYITAFIYLYLFMKKRLLHYIDLEVFEKYAPYRNYIFALIGGGTVGTILWLEPHAAFSGKDIVMNLINQQGSISILVIFAIIILRIVGTTVSIYSNAIGGIFLPLMSIGALAGYGFGELLFLTHASAEPFYFAATGAAVYVGVIMKLPLTAVVLAMETTFDYNIVVGTGVSVVVVSYLSELYFDIRKRYVTRADKRERKARRNKHNPSVDSTKS
jgi:CIC family chloride channel protein